MREIDEETKAAQARVKSLERVIRDLLPFVEDLTDAGPISAGYKSNEFDKALCAARAALDGILMEQNSAKQDDSDA
jgi:hypothetical protein